ncbi:MAG: cytochrome P450 [Myxococcota bacterium]
MISWMHAESPIMFEERINGWLVGSYADIQELRAESRLTNQRAGIIEQLTPPELHDRVAPLAEWYAGWMMMLDGAGHRRIRRLTAHAFQPRQLEHLQSLIDTVVAQLVGAALDKGELEVTQELAFPLPRTVICEMVGLPEQDRHLFPEWFRNISLGLSIPLNTAELIDSVAGSHAAMTAYFTEKIQDRRRTPREGEVLTGLVNAMEEGDSLSEREVIDLLAVIITGAYDTTAHLITNGLHLLLQHPEQLAAVRADPSLVDDWIEETLRFQPSIPINMQSVGEAFEYKGHRFEAGQMVFFLAGAANRDPAHFPDPHRFDIRRDNSRDHVAFGFGPHFCLGAPLARIEARRAFHGLLERTESLTLPEQEIRYLPNTFIRGLESLRVTLG